MGVTPMGLEFAQAHPVLFQSTLYVGAALIAAAIYGFVKLLQADEKKYTDQ